MRQLQCLTHLLSQPVQLPPLSSINIHLYFSPHLLNFFFSPAQQNSSGNRIQEHLIALQSFFPMKKLRQLLHANESTSQQQQMEDINRDIVDYLIKNAYLQNKMEFYLNLDPKNILKLINAPFQFQNIKRETAYFVVSLLKKNSFILNVAFNKENFNYREVFDVLNNRSINNQTLNIFEEIYVPFCKKFPHILLKILNNDPIIKQSFLNLVYTKPIYKVLYTAVFCLEHSFKQEYIQLIGSIIKQMVNSTLTFGPTKAIGSKALTAIFDCGQVAYNFKDFLSDLTTNLSSVDVSTICAFLSQMKASWINQTMEQFKRSFTKPQFQEYCQGVIMIFINILKLLEAFKLSSGLKFQANNKKSKQNPQQTLCSLSKQIATYLFYFTTLIKQKSSRIFKLASGQQIEGVGLLKYRILQLIERVLSLNQIEQLGVDFTKIDLFDVVQVFIKRYKWNNITHNILFEIVQLILSQDYDNFKEKYLKSVSNPGNSIFGNLVMQFRNRKFIFLHSLKMTDLGHRSLIFRISKAFVSQMQERNDLITLLENFKIWKEFMHTDMKEYEAKNYQISLHFNQLEFKRGQRPTFKQGGSLNTPILQYNSSNRPLQTISQILNTLKQEQKWSPKDKPNRLQKQQLMRDQTIKIFDSLAQYPNPDK